MMKRMDNECFRLGIDIGSTTAKLVIADHQGKIVFSRYRRHNAEIRNTIVGMLQEANGEFGGSPMCVAVTGSAGMGIAEALNMEFVQEVIASKAAISNRAPHADAVIELGGEDAKIIYLSDGVEQRMNGACAGGTGAFIDQMASLLNTDASGLNDLAKDATTIYPIASRCGVFAKSDIQPLLNEGARREDIAASIFQAVVNQTISGLACGRPIKGTVAFLGGPLHYLSELCTRFARTLGLSDSECVKPQGAHLFVALGAALQSSQDSWMTIEEMQTRLVHARFENSSEAKHMPALFASQDELDEFRSRHQNEGIKTSPIESYEGDAFLGIDAGSTTLKIAVIDDDGKLLYSHYGKNSGDVVNSALQALREMYETLPKAANSEPRAVIRHATVTGYGEELLKEALCVDSGEIETVAHMKAAQAFSPEVDFILDIGGQDMKCLHVKDDTIDRIMLNEACSSGCGSFLETFAHSMECTIEDFADMAVRSKSPVDLGSRCTVFMNSRVKQAQKEGAALEDIAAGLAYSVVKNALVKVIKARDIASLGENIVVQGGTFLNDAVLRAFENLCGRDVVRPMQAGLMGAYGAALIARERTCENATSTLIQENDLDNLEIEQTSHRCKGCENSCLLTISKFSSAGKKHSFVSGNRCERGDAHRSQDSDLPNMFEYKYNRLFSYAPLGKDVATRPTVGIPRALNMYENYPFWFTFFTNLGFRVELSSPSSRSLFECGMESIPSESVCYPAKLAHGHVVDLLRKHVDFVFMPCVRNERKEDTKAQNSFNCPIVSSYPEALRLNVGALSDSGIPLLDPYLPYDSKRKLAKRLHEELARAFAENTQWNGMAPSLTEVRRAVNAAWKEDREYKREVHLKGLEILSEMSQTGIRGIVLAGRPYHVDPEVNHGLPKMINELGYAVLTEDSVSWMARPERDLRAIDQWVFHSRLYSAAKLVTENADLELVQLNSFGCGLDAITTDQVQEIIEGAGKIYTSLKIDEVSNLGTARIRLRSLSAALEKRGAKDPTPTSTAFPKTQFTRQMKKDGYTIIAPQMAPIHFEILEAGFRAVGYKLDVLPTDDARAVECGLKYVNNDICYPSIITTGQVMAAVESGKYDLQKLAVLIPQTGGGCRATNYISLIRKALKESGHPDIPVISLSFKSMGEKNPGWSYSPRMIELAYYGMVLGDILMQCLLRTRPYEKVAGSANALLRSWLDHITKHIQDARFEEYERWCVSIVNDFDELPLENDGSKPKIGVVGEILAKFHPLANNHLVDVLEREGCEAVVPGFTDFFQYAALNTQTYNRVLNGSAIRAMGGEALYQAIDHFRQAAKSAIEKSKRFSNATPIRELAKKSDGIIQRCNCMGEGWLLTAEMIELIEHGASGIVLCSPFGCLPNHVIGKAVMGEMRRCYPVSNIVAVDYDPGASEVNQLNRIKLMIGVAKEQVEEAMSKMEDTDLLTKASSFIHQKLLPESTTVEKSELVTAA